MTDIDEQTRSDSASKNTQATAKKLDRIETSWGEMKATGKDVHESASTTYRQNSRFGLIENGTWVSPDRFDELVSRVPPLYEVTIPAGDTYIVSGSERNPYFPGSDFTAGFASQIIDENNDYRLVPDGVEVVQGLGDFRVGQEEGIGLKFEDEDAVFGAYQDNELSNTKSLNAGEWKFDPVADDSYQYDSEKFAVKRIEGNLYGSGSQSLFFKLRDVETGVENYQKVAEIGDPNEPIIDTFNLFNQIRVRNNSANPITLRFGPLQYFNENDSDVPIRIKDSPTRGLPVSVGLNDATGTVVGVYRLNPDRVQVPVKAGIGASAQTNGRVELREVHPDYIDFGTIDPDDPTNWEPPNTLNRRETALDQLQMTPGDVSLLTTAGGRAGGEQVSAVEYDGTEAQGNTPGESNLTTSSVYSSLSEFNYYVATARHEDTTVDINRLMIVSEESW